MCDITSLRVMNEFPFILLISGAAAEISESFSDFTGYLSEDLLNKKIIDIFKTLRVGPNINPENIDGVSDCFLFTKSLEVRFTSIQVIKEADRQIYVFKERPNSRLEDRCGYLYQLFTENIEGVSIYSTPDLILLKASQMYLDFFDAPYNTPENSYGRKIHDSISGWEDSSVDNIWKRVITSGKPECIREFKHDMFARGTTYWDTTITPIKEDEKVKYIIINTQEVTGRVLYKKELEEKNKIIEQQKKELDIVLDNMSDGFSIIDKHGNFTKLNKAAKQLANMEPNKIEDVFGSFKYYDIDGKELTCSELPASRIIRGEKIDKCRILMKSNETERYLSISGTPIYDEDGNFIMGVVNSRDITKTVEQSRIIKEQKEQMEAIINNMADTLMAFDRDGKYILKNKASSKSVNASSLGVVGDGYKPGRYFDLEGNELPLKGIPGFRVLNGEKLTEMVVTSSTPEGVNYLSVNGTPLFDDNGDFRMGILCVRDITKSIIQNEIIKQQKENLEKAIEMKDEFLSLISHEFRTPLNVINTAVQAMNFICGDELSDKAKEFIGTIRQNTFRQLRLVNNLLDITRANAGRIKVHKRNIDIVFLTKAITESVFSYASQKGVKLTFLSTLTSCVIGIDDEKYERILLNLLSNAIKFTPEGKSIVVKLHSIKNNICIEVKDDGIGIPDEKLGVIFERFGQVDSLLSRQAEGAGIGLSLVKKFVEALEGSISMKSRVGKGSTFSILLPSSKILDDQNENHMADFMDNHLVQVTTVEFSDIYL